MRRGGQIPEAHSDAWYDETAKSVYRPDIYLQAARLLVDEGLADEADFPWDSEGYKAPTPAEDFIAGVGFDGRQPNAYIDGLSIGLKGAQVVVGNQIQG
jgi:nitrate/nitrite transport system substrate-binding protein